MNKKSILIGIAGGTGSGKTSFAKKIALDYEESEVALIELDSYYKDLSKISMDERIKVNFDHPDAIDFKLIKEHLKKIILGEKINIPVYDFSTHTRLNKIRTINKHQIIILEGILALFDYDIRNMMDIKLYIDTPDDIRIIRRIKRDINKRKRSFSSVIDQYYKTVRSMHMQFVEPSKKYADIIIPEGGQNKVAVNMLRSQISTIINI